MRRIGINLVLVVSAAALLGFLHPGDAEAFTCTSICNQIRRACNSVAKADKNVAYAVCDEGRDACRLSCDCATACAAALADCLAACGSDTECQAACATANAECPAECPECCNYARASCRGLALAYRQEARLACEEARTTCWSSPCEPDRNCVRRVKSEQHGCRGSAQKASVQCKRACANGTERRACVRECRKILNMGLRNCSNQEVINLAGCM